jgi:biopolymer transport protein ExbD
MMRGRERGLSQLPEINVTNLVDVTVVLLIIFMITAPLMQSSLDIDVPRTQADRREIFEGLMVIINAEGELFLGNQPITMEEFRTRLDQTMEEDPSRPVYLKADQSVKYGKVVEVVGGIKEAGVTNLGLVVKPLEEKPEGK